MIDFGLLMSIIVAFGAPSALSRRWIITGYRGSVSFIDVAIAPAFVGLIVGRSAALALDDPASIMSLSDFLIIRSGVEFWPGVAAAALALVASARIYELPPLTRVAALAPLSMVGYAAYEAACVFRDGCFGPLSRIGLTPPGVESRMLPIGWIMAAAIIAGAMLTRRLGLAGHPRGLVVLTSLAWIAGVRAIGSTWLPHVGDGLTRQHLSSIALTAISLIAAVATRLSTSSGKRPDRISAQIRSSGSRTRP